MPAGGIAGEAALEHGLDRLALTQVPQGTRGGAKGRYGQLPAFMNMMSP